MSSGFLRSFRHPEFYQTYFSTCTIRVLVDNRSILQVDVARGGKLETIKFEVMEGIYNP